MTQRLGFFPFWGSVIPQGQEREERGPLWSKSDMLYRLAFDGLKKMRREGVGRAGKNSLRLGFIKYKD